MRTSTRDLEELRERLESWLTGRRGRPVTVSRLSRPDGNGMSSETLHLRRLRDPPRTAHELRCVARMAPASEAVPVFPDYDLGRQFEVMRMVRERAGVLVPRPLWFEPDPEPLGAPFFVMERLFGDVPPDVTALHLPGLAAGRLPRRPGAAAARRRVEILAALHDTAFTAEELGRWRSPGPAGPRCAGTSTTSGLLRLGARLDADPAAGTGVRLAGGPLAGRPWGPTC